MSMVAKKANNNRDVSSPPFCELVVAKVTSEQKAAIEKWRTLEENFRFRRPPTLSDAVRELLARGLEK